MGSIAIAVLGGCSINDVYDRPSVDIGSVTQSVTAPSTPTMQGLAPQFAPSQINANNLATGRDPINNFSQQAAPSFNDPLIAAAAQADPMANTQQRFGAQDITLGSQPQFLSVPTDLETDETGPDISPRMPQATLGNNIAPQKPEKKGFFTQMASMTSRIIPGLGNSSNSSDSACMRELRKLGVEFEALSKIGNPGGNRCGIANPVRVSGLASGIKVKPAATLNCQMALTFAKWVKEDVNPKARSTYLSGVDTVHQMSSYSCRTIGNKRGGTPSEHSFGNAIDIGKITLNSGKQVTVKKPGFFAIRESSMLKNIRSDACKKFTTVLGPGYNAAHADHFHFDLMDRNRKTCK